jgi:hypothetical protein
VNNWVSIASAPSSWSSGESCALGWLLGRLIGTMPSASPRRPPQQVSVRLRMM